MTAVEAPHAAAGGVEERGSTEQSKQGDEKGMVGPTYQCVKWKS